jgi:hypothetical protein
MFAIIFNFFISSAAAQQQDLKSAATCAVQTFFHNNKPNTIGHSQKDEWSTA